MSISILYLYALSAIWVISFVGYGIYIFYLLEKIAEKSLLMVLFFCGLLGICIVSVLGNFINLFFPLGQEISLVILVVGLLLAIINIKIIPRIKSNELLLPIVAFFICFGLAQIGYPTFGGDTLTYHIQIVKWTQESKTPIGLVHLFERLASNNSLFTVAATVELGHFKNYSVFITNGFFLFFIACGFAHSIDIIFRDEKTRLSSIFLFLSGFTIFAGTYKFLGNLYVELSAATMTIAITYLMLRIIENKHYPEEQKKIFYILSIFALFSITLKLSMLVFAITSIVISFYLLDKNIRNTFDKPIPIAIATVIILPWQLKSILMSGTLLYPISETRLPFLSWTISAEECTRISTVIKEWARFGGTLQEQNHYPLSWVTIWFHNVFMRDIDISRSLGVIALACLVYSYARFAGKYTKIDGRYLYTLIPIGYGLLYWFLTAPDGRFAFALWYSLSFLLVSYAILSLTFQNSKPYKKITVIAFLLAICIATYNDTQKKISEFPLGATFPGIEHADYERIKSPSGAYYSSPKQNTTCGDAPLPCKEPPPMFIQLNIDFFNKTGLTEPLH